MILASGGSDFTQNPLPAQYRPEVMHLPTTNGEHCIGDGVKMGEAIGGIRAQLFHDRRQFEERRRMSPEERAKKAVVREVVGCNCAPRKDGVRQDCDGHYRVQCGIERL